MATTRTTSSKKVLKSLYSKLTHLTGLTGSTEVSSNNLSVYTKIANTPQSYELFDTLEEEIAAREKTIPSPTESELDSQSSHITTLSGSNQKSAQSSINRSIETTTDAKIERKTPEPTATPLKEITISVPEEPISYMVIGCHGELTTEQKNVASAMKAFMASNGCTGDTKKAEQDYKLPHPLPERALPIKLQQAKPFACFMAGDNFYHSGVKSPTDPLFQTCFYDIYLNSNKKNGVPVESPLPSFYPIVWGNHDLDITSLSTQFGPKTDSNIGINQIIHTYINPVSGKIDKQKLTYLNQSFINLQTLKKLKIVLFMPSRFYDITYKGTTFLMLDSNHFGSDYLEYIKLPNEIIETKKAIEAQRKLLPVTRNYSHEEALIENEIKQLSFTLSKLETAYQNNQAHWLEQAFTRHPHTRKVLMWHHPVYTHGKRAIKVDTHHYLTKKEIVQLTRLKICVDQDYSRILKDILLQLKTPSSNGHSSVFSSIDMFHCAHEHINSVYNNIQDKTKNPEHRLHQFMTGGGGGPCNSPYVINPEEREKENPGTIILEEKEKKNPDTIPSEKREKEMIGLQNIGLHTLYGYGVVSMTSDPQSVLYTEVVTLDGGYWCFNSQSIDPVFNWKYIPSPENQTIYLEIHALLKEACHAYFKIKNGDSNKFAIDLFNGTNHPVPKNINYLLYLINPTPPIPKECMLMEEIKKILPGIITILKRNSIFIPDHIMTLTPKKDRSNSDYLLEVEEPSSYSDSTVVVLSKPKKPTR